MMKATEDLKDPRNFVDFSDMPVSEVSYSSKPEIKQEQAKPVIKYVNMNDWLNSIAG
ncbi:MAG: hypothetical protein MZU97_09030 [Bacillus subtilis]|nr:hypothetical protein [Bacillus subtilis]